jgi:hypothetical protein
MRGPEPSTGSLCYSPQTSVSTCRVSCATVTRKRTDVTAGLEMSVRLHIYGALVCYLNEFYIFH